MEALQGGRFDVLLTDLMMPGMDGVSLLGEALRSDPQIVGILMTGKGTVETAVAAMKAGALDYVLKPVRLNAIKPVLARALDVRRLRLENLELRDTVAIHELNEAMAHTLDASVLLDRIADAALAQFDADEASVMLLSDEGDFLRVAAVRGAGRERLLGERLPVGEGIAGKVALTREPLVLQGEAKGPGPVPARPRSDIFSALSMPMVTRGKLIGVLNVGFTRKPGQFSMGQVRVLGIFTNAAAAGIEAARLHESQRKADSRYRLVLDMAADAIISFDADRRVIIYNGAAERIFGWSREEIAGQPLDLFIPAAFVDAHRQHVGMLDAGADSAVPMPARGPFPARRKDGSEFPAEISIARTVEGGRAVYSAIVRDVSLRVQQERRIGRLTRIHRVLSGINSAIVRIGDRTELLDEACRIAVELGGFGIAWIGRLEPQAGEVVAVASWGADAPSILAKGAGPAQGLSYPGQGLVSRALQDLRAAWSNDLATDAGPGDERTMQALQRGYRSLIVLPLVVEGNPWGSLSLFAREPGFFDEQEIKLLNELAADISFALDHIAKSERLDFLAFYDALTGLPNQALFADRIDHAVGSGDAGRSGLVVAVMDIERMHNINESLGIAAGDELIRQLGRRLEELVGGTGTVARLGSDVFGVAARHGDDPGQNALFVENCLLKGLAAPFRIGGQEISATVRAGIATYPEDGQDAARLRSNAEAARLRAKQRGERLLFYSRDMNARVSELLRLENDLRNALAREQFTLFYQPKFELAGRGLVGAEALMRWKHPDRGMVSPGDFIPLLEETGMILEVGRWALRRAARDQASWMAAGWSVPRIAVNVSAVQLRHPDFVSHIQEALAGNGHAHGGIDIEITESMLMQDTEENMLKLRSLREMGLRIALDDFGTGYSSLSYLTRLPLDSLKIDRSFITQMAKSPEQMTIVSSVISLGTALDLKVVAEGVETEEQANLLRLLRCDEVQGYLFGKPMPAEQFEKLLPRA
jgi:PAS domain S-box-containing protein/diguanylate cyclase (GGDEF)-like protein